jgi:hypothetical protein
MATISNYYDAVHYFNNSLILCNHIAEIDSSVYDNMMFPPENEEGYPIDIYQWFLTDCTAEDAEYLANRFGLLFAYSDTLEVFVLCVDHCGTMWKGVSVTDNEQDNEE